MHPEKRQRTMLLEIMTNQLSESAVFIMAFCAVISVAAMVCDSLLEHARSGRKIEVKENAGFVWNEGREGIDTEGVPFSGLAPMPELSARPIVTPDGVPCLTGDDYMEIIESQEAVSSEQRNGDERFANHGIA